MIGGIEGCEQAMSMFSERVGAERDSVKLDRNIEVPKTGLHDGRLCRKRAKFR